MVLFLDIPVLLLEPASQFGMEFLPNMLPVCGPLTSWLFLFTTPMGKECARQRMWLCHNCHSCGPGRGAPWGAVGSRRAAPPAQLTGATHEAGKLLCSQHTQGQGKAQKRAVKALVSVPSEFRTHPGSQDTSQS